MSQGNPDFPLGVRKSEGGTAIGAQFLYGIHPEQGIEVEYQHIHWVYHAGADFERADDSFGFGENLHAEPVIGYIVGSLFGLQGTARIIGGQLGVGNKHKTECRQQERYPVHRKKL